MRFGHLDSTFPTGLNAPSSAPLQFRPSLNAGVQKHANVCSAPPRIFTQKGFAETPSRTSQRRQTSAKAHFQLFSEQDHILLAFGEMQLSKLESAIRTVPQQRPSPCRNSSALGVRMTRNPHAPRPSSGPAPGLFVDNSGSCGDDGLAEGPSMRSTRK